MPEGQLEFDEVVDEAYAAWEMAMPLTPVDRRLRMRKALLAAGVADLIEWQRQVLTTLNGTTPDHVVIAAEPFDFDIGMLFDSLRTTIADQEATIARLSGHRCDFDCSYCRAGADD